MQRRNKPSKTCTNCQRKKVRCDRKVPACTACSERGYNCIYNVKIGHPQKNYWESLKKPELIATIEILKAKLEEKEKSSSKRNLLTDLKYISSKHGRVICYGATSFRFAVRSPSLKPHFAQLWEKIKTTRNRWKQENHFLLEIESNSIDTPLSFVTAGSILEGLCAVLPNFEKVTECMHVFFNSNLFSSFAIMDPSKVLSDVHSCLIHDENVSTGSRITSFDLGDKKNYYRVGIITQILCLVYYKNKVPLQLRFFHNSITSFVLSKASYLERVQFFMLRYMCSNITGFTVGDGGTCTSLVMLAFSTAVHIGLFKEETHCHFRDNSIYLYNLWAWILYADFEASFAVGSPLHIGQEFEYQRKVELGTFHVFKDSVLFFRRIMRQIYSPHSTPNLESLILELKSFFTARFGTFASYVENSHAKHISFEKLFVMLLVLQMISNFSIIEGNLLEKDSFCLQQNTLYCQLISLKLILDNLNSTFEIYKDLTHTREHDYSVSFSLALCLYHCIMPRLTYELFSVLSKLALSDNDDSSTTKVGLFRVGLQDFLKHILYYEKSVPELRVDALTAVGFLDAIHQNFIDTSSEELFLRLRQSYLFVLSDSFILSTRSAIEAILNKDEFQQSMQNDFQILLTEPIIDFFHDEDVPLFLEC
ncbi:ZYRO0A13596p [Zygosaccharomyces rouxii]|uniref:ZYRO0A13596p n=1 Tax=Zygosaccharomyces rouxii (strain ATCC 2623 / CBS 732 / NBRC 1130 / NCYC 568 / NRRL Y-229) TaxID=559307 RepID=C5DP25_ZYGRC|nr:uncharacterized protein ZYRO0A13596g [Zygosaccharomyces rouxii]KAH9198462.1 hypothetical protein LQ764DRAFT_214190 [Zygosaccharomyces rouxii]CAR26016.1 ZYRO0A13596p [Zygosaccharomyces rouxii]